MDDFNASTLNEDCIDGFSNKRSKFLMVIDERKPMIFGLTETMAELGVVKTKQK